MSNYFNDGLNLHLIFFQALVLLVILSNVRFLRNARRHVPPIVFPPVAILVPARNEEKNIARCIRSLLAQDYPSFEILALDDQSSDATGAILEQMARTNPQLQVVRGSPPPEGYVGKNWACVQLAQQVQADLLLFTDADTLHRPDALRTIVTALIGEKADLLTGFPHQEVSSWGERLLVPFFSWAFLCFNPILLAYKFRLPWLSNAVGQMMLFRRGAYQAIGGHAQVSSSITEDLALARRIKAAGLRWRVLHITDLISCHMYGGSREAFDGFSKNLFAAFDFRLLTYSFAFLWLAVMFWEPLIVLALWFLGRAPQARPEQLAVCIGLSVLVWLIPYAELGIPIGLAVLYPVTILAIEAVAVRSVRLSLAGSLTWKGRTLAAPHWKWF
jgi:chlorobactene glucosyltransferase